jgi:cell division protein FtsW (lipid II flippase)
VELKPTDLILAFMQFLEILVPGAFVSFLMKDFADKHIFGTGLIVPKVVGDAQRWVVFFFASYLLGHFVFLLATFIDSIFYDPARKTFKPSSTDLAFQKAKVITRRQLQEEDGEEAVNPFQWAKARMNLAFPAALSEVKRHESDSKFFRSLVVVFLAIAVVQSTRSACINVVICILFSLLSFWRYFDQRWKSTQVAYIHLIAMEDLGHEIPGGPVQKEGSAPATC